MSLADDRDKPRPKRTFTIKEAKLKAADYCAYQERTQQQVRDKLYDYGLYRDEVEEVIATLIVEGFINEERFAIAYAGGKFRMKKWGRVKILQGLNQHRLSAYCIQKAMESIDQEAYEDTLKQIIAKKQETEKETDLFKKKHKIARHAIGKGFEPALVWEVIGATVNDQ